MPARLTRRLDPPLRSPLTDTASLPAGVDRLLESLCHNSCEKSSCLTGPQTW
jgi:hypothetical protein